MKNCLLLTVLLSLLSSCLGKVPTVLIAKGNLSGAGTEGIEAQNSVITDDKTWNDLMNQMNRVNNETNRFEETDIDFSKDQIIAVFNKVNGHKLDLKITKNSERIKVDISHIMPENKTMPIIQPYYIVKIPVSNLPVIFEIN